ncbi:MAG: hypothetical protein QME79_06790 [Bacillota bacterium]|nr:hypothetical protein [Bacillota bacterium]
MRGTYIGQNRVLVEPTWGGRLIVPADDYSIGFDLITAGEIEPALTRFLQRTVRPGQTAVDVGANLGYHTILLGTLVGPQGRVFAYEPNPHLLPFLRANVASNYL